MYGVDCSHGVGLQGVQVGDADLPVSINVHQSPHDNGASRLEVVRSVGAAGVVEAAGQLVQHRRRLACKPCPALTMVTGMHATSHPQTSEKRQADTGRQHFAKKQAAVKL